MGKLAVNYNGVSSAQFVSIDVKSTYWLVVVQFNGTMRKKSIILFILLLCMAFGVVCYVTWMRGIEEAIHFIKEDSPREILWGESLAEKDFVELDSSARDATVLFHYDDSIINKEQLLTVTVSCNGYKTSRAFNLTIVDRDPPIIKYTGPVKIESDPNVRLSDYLKVYDVRPYDKVVFDLQEKDGDKAYRYYEYTCDENNQTCSFDEDAVGVHTVHISAYDGHGNQAYKTIKIIVTSPAYH